jgi:hypothetical protein
MDMEKTMITESRSPAAERMKRSRERRRNRMRCLTVELRETEINILTQKGFLQPDARNDANAVRRALYQFFDDTLNPNDVTRNGGKPLEI